MAANLLNDGTAAHILYYYLACNADNYSFALSPTYVRKEVGITEKQYHTAKKRLKDTGYLVPDGSRRNHYRFLRIPTQYESAEVGDNEKSGVSSPEMKTSDETACPLSGIDSVQRSAGDDAVCPDVATRSTHAGIDTTPIEGQRNNINNINKVITKSNPVVADNPEEKESELLEWIQRITDTFGHLQDCPFEILDAESRAKQNGRYSIDKHIYWIKKTFVKMKDRQKINTNAVKNHYAREVSATMPATFKERTIVSIILDRLTKEKKIGSNCGVWIDGWDEERQEPKLVTALNTLPLDVVKRQRHNINEIPEWYWRRK